MAFGEYDAELVRVEPAHLFPKDIHVGMQLEGAARTASTSMLYTVTDVAEGQVVVTAIIPWPGRASGCNAACRKVRAAFPEEVETPRAASRTGITITDPQSIGLLR